MKKLQIFLIGVIIAGGLVLLTVVSHAQAQPKSQSMIDVLKESATALEQSHPDLSKDLAQAVAEIEGANAKQRARMKLFKDSSDALKEINPQLSEKLAQFATPKPFNTMPPPASAAQNTSQNATEPKAPVSQ